MKKDQLHLEHKKIPHHARRILDFLSENKKAISRLLILTHDNPDPDALASAYALRYLAQQVFDIHATLVYGGVIGRMENRNMVDILRIPVHPLKASHWKKYKNIVLVDTQPGFGNNPFPRDRRATMVIDQHPSVHRPAADLLVIDSHCGATCVILAQALLALKIEIPTRLATAIAYGILSETLGLYRGATHRVVQTYLRILRYADMRVIAKIQNPVRSQNFFKTLGHSIYNSLVYQQLIICHLGFVENPDLVAQMADFLLTYRGIRWAFCTGRYQGKLHVSLRTNNPKAKSGEILRDVLGKRERAGGHGMIGGGSLEVGEHVSIQRWKRLEEKISRKLAKRLRLASHKRFQFAFR